MNTRRSFALVSVAVMMVLMSVLTACGATPTPTATAVPQATTAPTTVPATAAPTKAPATATAVPSTATPAPTVGGTVRIRINGDPDTLDIHKSGMTVMSSIMVRVGGALVDQDPSGKFVPYLADSWKFSDDGLTWTFILKKGVKFHDGSPLTAQDYAWTFNRAIDPATKSPGAGAALVGSLKSASATDAQTLVLNMKQPFFPLLVTLSQSSYCAPLPQKAVEAAGDKWGRNPIGVGPWKFKEWQTGQKIVLERNADYKWAPAYYTKGGPFIQNLEFDILAEDAISLVGLEAGDLDYNTFLAKDYERLKATGKLQIFEAIAQGCQQYVQLNVAKFPFDDLKVRQALSYAVDRAPILKTVASGQGVEQYGPLSPTVNGYWSGIEALGYHFDLAKAKQLMADAGWKANASGILEKGGKTFKFAVRTNPADNQVKTATILIEQWKALGADVSILQEEQAGHVSNVLSGSFEASIFGWGSSDADILLQWFGTSALGGMDGSKANDANLDKLLSATRTTMDPDKRQLAVNEAVKYIMAQALLIPTIAAKSYIGLNNRVQGAVFSSVTNTLYLTDAWVAK